MVTTDPRWHDAVKAFWFRRGEQTERQLSEGHVHDAGTRSSVTGGKHLDPLADAIVSLFTSDPVIGSELRIYNGSANYLPGWYRESKNWDIVVTYRRSLVAVIELKSQVGSFGNNFNNRVEESIGNAVDLWKANDGGALGAVRPWTAYVMIVEDSADSRRPVLSRRIVESFDSDPTFAGLSYIDRYRIALSRLHAEGQYDAVVLATSERGQGVSEEPIAALSFANLQAAIAGRLAYIGALPADAFAAQ